jgi:hypothetical protein
MKFSREVMEVMEVMPMKVTSKPKLLIPQIQPVQNSGYSNFRVGELVLSKLRFIV